jgi:hypothetical protein
VVASGIKRRYRQGGLARGASIQASPDSSDVGLGPVQQLDKVLVASQALLQPLRETSVGVA